MSYLQARIKSLSGGLISQNKAELRENLFDNGVRFTGVVAASDTFVICLNGDDVDKIISTSVGNVLTDLKFTVIIPPPLRARKSVVIKRTDQEITT